MEEFILALDGRLEALTQAHALLGRCRRVGFAKLVSRQLAPYADARNTTLAGPNVALPAAATEALAMALHELVTNAAKYGALSVPGGHVCVKWGHCMGGDQLEVFRVQWRESGGPLVKQPTRAGFGIQLIRELIPYECGGTVELVFAAGGLSCTLDIPSAKQEAARLSDLRPSNPWTPFNRAGPQRLKVD
jgi:two-component sensor histidine kinase